MNYKKIIIITGALFLLTPLFSVSATVIGMRNPAAAYCVDLGYDYEIKKTPAGEYGVCKFPDGSEAEEWKFFAGQEKREYNFCTRNGYGTKTVSDERCVATIKCTLCILEDGTEKEMFNLMNLKVIADQDNNKQKVAETKITETNYFENMTGYLIGVIIVSIILVIFFIFRKMRK